VGAVVVRGDRVLGRGYTRPVGGDHAEVVALRAAHRRHGRAAVRGATIAATLEPCAHRGRTGPCADLLIEAGVAKVLVGHRDPHPEVAGRGLRRLRRAGIEVELGVLAADCRRQHRGFLTVLEKNRPFTILKLAGTLDGRIATSDGESRWITGPEARAVVHRLRARVDAVAVGSGTATADDPELTARRGERVVHRPIRVVVDSGLRVAPTSRLYRGEIGQTWVLCAKSASPTRLRAVAATGAKVLRVPLARLRKHLDLRKAMEVLAREGLTEILVEGGGELAAALMRASLVDEVHWFLAPTLLGGDARAALGALAIGRLAQAPQLDDVEVRRVGRDVWVRGTIGTTGSRNKKTGSRKKPTGFGV
jgi:diaminohydroxyphosphoribosylaminopyrimidine deaminase/5-amino-6-(5-phosphoribosylamino)uracil reductase